MVSAVPENTPAELARWRWRARTARKEFAERFAHHGRELDVEWCDYEQSAVLRGRARALGPSPDRQIQRWHERAALESAVRASGAELLRAAVLYVSFDDVPDAQWAAVDVEQILASVIPAATRWMTDGVVILHPDAEALVSIDIDDTSVESTVIGTTFGQFAEHLRRIGPEPLPIVGNPPASRGK